jgi:hypothetical protein
MWCSLVMMHKGQTHIKRNCFSIDINSNQLQSGYYRRLRTRAGRVAFKRDRPPEW